MTKKLFVFFIILLISILFFNISHASDVLMDLTNASANTAQTNDPTIYSATPDTNNEIVSTENNAADLDTAEEQVATTTDYDNSGELSISNMINIILIVVGIVLVLLGIAIIIKLK